MVKRLPAMRETRVRSLGWEDLLEKERATHSGTLAWRIPRTEEPGRLQSMGSQRVGHDWATSLSLSHTLRVSTVPGTEYSKHFESEGGYSCPTLCNPMDCSLPGSSVRGIFQARVLEWVAVFFSKRSSQPRDWIQVLCIIWATREAPNIFEVFI